MDVIRVEVTADGGDSWTPAELRGAEGLQAAGDGVSGGGDSTVAAVLVHGRQGGSGRVWAWTLWRARVPVRGGLAKAAAAALGKTTISKDSSSSRGAGSEQQQQAMHEAVEQKHDRQQQAQQGGTAAAAAAAGDSQAGSAKSAAAAGAAAAAAGGDAGGGVDDGAACREGRQLVCLAVKAMDARFSSQPSEVGSIWNIRGVGNNAWHRVEVYV